MCNEPPSIRVVKQLLVKLLESVVRDFRWGPAGQLSSAPGCLGPQVGRRDQLGAVTPVAGLDSSGDFCTLVSGPWQGWLSLARMTNQSTRVRPLQGSGLWAPANRAKHLDSHGMPILPHAVIGHPALRGGDVDPTSSWQDHPGSCSLNTATLPFFPFYFDLGA